MPVDVFSDASEGRHGFAGAYVVGRGGEPVGIQLTDCRNSTEAELEASLYGLQIAQSSHRGEPIIIHTDLASISGILARGRYEAAVLLRHELGNGNLRIIADARYFEEYRKCHRFARIEAGIRGSRHPLIAKKKKAKGEKRRKAHTRIRMRLVLDALNCHLLGVSELRLAQETGLPLATLHKTLRLLESDNAARCERPADAVGACDMRQLIWFRGPSFGTCLGNLLLAEGIQLTQEPQGD